MKQNRKTQKNINIDEEFNNFLEKHNLKVLPSLEFPEYKIYPVDLQLALEVLKRHKHKFVMNFVKKEEK